MNNESAPTLTPRLIVQNADEAIDFYQNALGARLVERYALPNGQVVHAALALGNSIFSLAEEKLDWGNPSPATLGGSPLLLTVQSDDPDALCRVAVAHGARVIVPIADQFYGHREGRIEDPFGHLWILSKITEDLSPAEIERRMQSFGD